MSNNQIIKKGQIAQFIKEGQIAEDLLKDLGAIWLATEYKKLANVAIHEHRENMQKVAEEFNKMIRDAEEIYAERPDMRERKKANINRQMESVMRANEQILDNLLQLLTTKI